MKQKVCIFTGARPNFVKVAPIIAAIGRTEHLDYDLVYAGKADDPTLEPSMFSDLGMPAPNVFLGVDCENLNELTGRVMSEMDCYLEQHQDVATVIVVDDLASTMAAAIVTKKRGLRLAHLVAGTRSFDIKMPKEINRLVIDGLSDLLFTAGVAQSSIATREGAEMHKIYMVGNILMDSLRQNHDRWQRPACLAGIADGSYLVFTLNRKALMANEANLSLMLQAINKQAANTQAVSGQTQTQPVKVIAPLRGRARQLVQRMVDEQHLDNILVTDAMSYLEFGYLTAHAKGVITDSGNVAEEATWNHVPCITLNSYTEHQETVKVGTNILVGEDAAKLQDALADIMAGRWKEGALPDRWDGRSAERIVRILLEH